MRAGGVRVGERTLRRGRGDRDAEVRLDGLLLRLEHREVPGRGVLRRRADRAHRRPVLPRLDRGRVARVRETDLDAVLADVAEVDEPGGRATRAGRRRRRGWPLHDGASDGHPDLGSIKCHSAAPLSRVIYTVPVNTRAVVVSLLAVIAVGVVVIAGVLLLRGHESQAEKDARHQAEIYCTLEGVVPG